MDKIDIRILHFRGYEHAVPGDLPAQMLHHNFWMGILYYGYVAGKKYAFSDEVWDLSLKALLFSSPIFYNTRDQKSYWVKGSPSSVWFQVRSYVMSLY